MSLSHLPVPVARWNIRIRYNRKDSLLYADLHVTMAAALSTIKSASVLRISHRRPTYMRVHYGHLPYINKCGLKVKLNTQGYTEFSDLFSAHKSEYPILERDRGTRTDGKRIALKTIQNAVQKTLSRC
jgi:hypothetical protein